jgi:hypothetical protein
MNQFHELQEAIAALQDRFDNLASFFGTKIKDLEGEVRYWRGVIEGQRLAEVPAFPGAKGKNSRSATRGSRPGGKTTRRLVPAARPTENASTSKSRVLDELGSSR